MTKQDWYWTEQWQKGEREADEQMKNGEVSKKMNLNEIMEHLDKLMESK